MQNTLTIIDSEIETVVFKIVFNGNVRGKRYKVQTAKVKMSTNNYRFFKRLTTSEISHWW